MQSFWASRGSQHNLTQILTMLKSFGDECCGTLAWLIAYVGALALLGILGMHFWDNLPSREATVPGARPNWTLASRSFPAFAVSKFDISDKTETYEIFRHPLGGRKDIFHWAGAGARPLAELEIYRLGGEENPSTSAIPALAAHMETGEVRELEEAGVIDSKFGAVSLFFPVGESDRRTCLGFIKRFDDPELTISGWSCQGATWPARRAAIGCMLNRLTLLTSGNEPRLAELFARAELKRGSCGTAAAASGSEDWITGTENPPLRAAL